MKRILSIILLALMIFATSCNFAPTNSDTDTNTSTDSSVNTDSSGNNSLGGGNGGNIEYTEDQNKYEATTNEDGTINYLKEKLTAPYFTPYYHNYKTALSFTFDDGYDVNTGYIINDVFSRYGFRGTLMLNSSYLAGEDNASRADAWRDVVSKGYLDVGNHGYDHINPLTISPSQMEKEVKTSFEFLREQFPGQLVLTYATPYSQINNAYKEYLSNYAITNRLEAFGALVKLGTDFDPYTIKGISLDERNSGGYENLRSSIDQSVLTGNWMVMVCHCVKEGAVGVDLELSRFEEFTKWIYNKHNGKIWVASFQDVSIYSEQIKHSKINYLSADYQSLTFNITTDLDRSVYSFPMSIAIQLPKNADSAYVIIDGKEYDYPVTNSGPYTKEIVVLDVPTDGTEVKVVYGGNKNYKNGCLHHFYKKSYEQEASCTERGFTEKECIYCQHTYITEYIAPKHDFERVSQTREEQRENGRFLVTYTICKICQEEKILKEEYLGK